MLNATLRCKERHWTSDALGVSGDFSSGLGVSGEGVSGEGVSGDFSSGLGVSGDSCSGPAAQLKAVRPQGATCYELIAVACLLHGTGAKQASIHQN